MHAGLLSCFLCVAVLTIKDLAKVRQLTFQASSKWRDIGLDLGLESGTLDKIKHDFQSADDCYREMLSVWLKKITPAPSVETLIATLKQPYVGYAYLVQDVQKAFEVAGAPSINSAASGVGED